MGVLDTIQATMSIFAVALLRSATCFKGWWWSDAFQLLLFLDVADLKNANSRRDGARLSSPSPRGKQETPRTPQGGGGTSERPIQQLWTELLQTSGNSMSMLLPSRGQLVSAG